MHAGCHKILDPCAGQLPEKPRGYGWGSRLVDILGDYWVVGIVGIDHNIMVSGRVECRDHFAGKDLMLGLGYGLQNAVIRDHPFHRNFELCRL